MKHFETATTGSRNARALLAFEEQHGPIIEVVEKIITVPHWWDGSLRAVPALFALFTDGNRIEVPAYAGDTPDRIRAIAALEWVEEVDWPASQARRDAGIPLPEEDRTGARLAA
jgi:hypothetical protein